MRVLLITAILLAASASVSAESVYQWTDADGVIHYSDVPPPKDVDADVKGLDPIDEVGTVQPEEGALSEIDAVGAEAVVAASEETEDLSPAEQARRERQEKRAKREEEQKKLQAQCSSMREQLSVYEPNPRVLIETADGSVERMPDDARLKMVDEARDFLNQNCGGAELPDANG